jgi:hypothetical protein
MSTQSLLVLNDASPQNLVTSKLVAERGTFKELVTFGLGVNELDAVTGVFDNLASNSLAVGGAQAPTPPNGISSVGDIYCVGAIGCVGDMSTGATSFGISTLTNFPNNLFYEELTVIGAPVNGGPGPVGGAANVYWTRTGKNVTVRISNFQWDVGSSGTNICDIPTNPVGFRPTQAVVTSAPINMAGTPAIGIFMINPNATIYFYGPAAAGVDTTAGNNAFLSLNIPDSIVLSYSIY